MVEGKIKKAYSEEELMEIAIKRIKIKRSLITDIVSYIIINGFLVLIYYLTKGYFYSGSIPWYVWPIAGWGLGIAFHISSTYQDLHYKYNVNALNKELNKIQNKNDE